LWRLSPVQHPTEAVETVLSKPSLPEIAEFSIAIDE
jgi:hypothetical protein